MNINDYIGIPYKEFGRDKKGCDCYGFIRILLQDFKKISLPIYDNVESDKALHSSLIIEKRKDWQEVYIPKFGDIVCFKIFGLVIHVGMMISKDQFLHSWSGIDSCCENINAIAWRHRVDGFFRYIY